MRKRKCSKIDRRTLAQRREDALDIRAAKRAAKEAGIWGWTYIADARVLCK